LRDHPPLLQQAHHVTQWCGVAAARDMHAPLGSLSPLTEQVSPIPRALPRLMPTPRLVPRNRSVRGS
jgi:hypothetical protein